VVGAGGLPLTGPTGRVAGPSAVAAGLNQSAVATYAAAAVAAAAAQGYVHRLCISLFSQSLFSQL